jgi:phosphate-selective porin OprO/OprP
MTKTRFNRLVPMSSMAALAAVLATASAPAFANMEALLEKLHSKGVLSDEEYKEMRQEAREATRANREFKADTAAAQEAAKKNLVAKDGFKFTDGKNWEIGLTGRINLDYRFNDDFGSAADVVNDRDTASIADGFELRRARLGFAGYVWKDFKYNFLFNAVGSAPIADEFWVNYDANPKVQVQLGRFKQPFSLEQLTSSNAIDFAERSYNDQNGVPAKKLGAQVHGEPKKGFTYAASVFQEGFNEITAEDGEGKRYAGRLTANIAELANINDTVLHFGIAGVGGDYTLRPGQSSQTSSGASNQTRAIVSGFRTMNRGLSNVYRARIGGVDLNCGSSPNVCDRTGKPSEFGVNVDGSLFGWETSLARGPLKVQGEYVVNDLDATNAIDVDETVRGKVKTFYVQAVWNLTGEKWASAYKGGKFGGLKPNNNFSSGGGWGAWQLGVRYSEVDASDLIVTGDDSTLESGANPNARAGRMNEKFESYGIGLNWLLNPNARVMFEYTRTNFGGVTQPLDTSGAGGTGSDKEDLFLIRSQLNF